jgi:hypothetical protein
LLVKIDAKKITMGLIDGYSIYSYLLCKGFQFCAN